MSKETKPQVEKETTFDPLDIRLGRVTAVELEPSAPKQAYKLTVDFGKYGIKTSVGRFTKHTPQELLDQLVLGVLNFGARQIGEVMSDVLILGVQYPKAESGEATPITALKGDTKIGGKLF